MEHYRSTLGTAAAAVFGLVVAARVLHPGNFEDQPRPARQAAAQAVAASAPAPATARVDPPFDLYLRPSASASEMAVLAPRMTAPLPTGMTMAPVLPVEMAAAAGRPLKAAAARPRKAVQRIVRVKQAATTRDRTVKAVPAVGGPAQDGALDVSSRDLGSAAGGEG